MEKGAQGELCNVTRCTRNQAFWQHKDNHKWYCRRCAMQINPYDGVTGFVFFNMKAGDELRQAFYDEMERTNDYSKL